MKWTNKGHEYDAVSGILAGRKHCYIYGAGWTGVNLLEMLLPLNDILGWDYHLIDINKGLQGWHKLGVVIEPPDALVTADKNDSFVVICNGNDTSFSKWTQVTMKAVCLECGFKEGTNIFSYKEFLMRYLSVHLWYQHKLVYFWSLNIVPSTICNLNCKCCLNFNPYIKKHTHFELPELIVSVDNLFKSIDLISRFQITGGEPVLYKNLPELIEYIGSRYRNKILRFEIVMNATLVPSKEVFDAIQKYGMYVYLDDYIDSVPQSKSTRLKIAAEFLKRGIVFNDNYTPTWFNLTPCVETEWTNDETKLSEHFTKCMEPYATIENSTISACNYALYAHKAGLVEYEEKEYFPLPARTDEEKIALIEFRTGYNERGYTELCKRCKGLTNMGACDLVDVAVQIPKSSKTD